MLKRVVFSATRPKNSSTSMQVKSQAQRIRVQTLKGAVLQHDNVSGGRPSLEGHPSYSTEP